MQPTLIFLSLGKLMFRILKKTENNNLYQISGIVLMVGARGTMSQFLTKLDNNSAVGLF